MNIEEFKEYIRTQRDRIITKPTQLVTEVFEDLEFLRRHKSFFLDHPSEFIMIMRGHSWDRFRTQESKFNSIVTRKMLEDSMPKLKPRKVDTRTGIIDLICKLLQEKEEHLFELNKSNTNSRRSRAGAELEAIFELLLLMIKIHFDAQGSIGKLRFEQAGLSKLVDFVVPGVLEYKIEKHKCALISMKTSLRERWQEVPEELNRTGAHLIYLFTLDQHIQGNVIESLAAHNISLVVLDNYKESIYRNNTKIFGLRKLMKELVEINKYWANTNELNSDYFRLKEELYLNRSNKNANSFKGKIFEEHAKYFSESGKK